MIGAGDRAPDVAVWLAPDRRVGLHELAPPGEGLLVLAYLFDWSAT